jgi:predicted anti-sigma-YlaC factor YlaD
VSCEQVREALSAILDGEDPGVAEAEAEAHVEGCAACRGWYEAAARVTRQARLGAAVQMPDLSDVVVRAWRPSRRLLVVRVALAVLGVGQFAATALQLWVWPMTGGPEMPGMTDPMHLEHESAAWGFALAVGFCWIAWQIRRASGLVPVLGAFVLVLSVLVALDLHAGTVTVGRVASHGLVVAAFALVVYLSRVAGRGGLPMGGTPRTGPVDGHADLVPHDAPQRNDRAA